MNGLDEKPVIFEFRGETLVGVLHPATNAAARLGVLVVVGGPQYRVGSHRQFVLMARDLARAGFPVLRFDYRGMGDSDGESTNFEAVGDDIRAATDRFLEAQPALDAVVLWGLCDAASAALMEGHRDRRVVGLILANPWVRTEAGKARAYLDHYYRRRLLQRSFWAKALSGKFSPARAAREWWGTWRRASKGGSADAATGHFLDRMLYGLRAFRGPMLLLISENDLTAQEFVAYRAASRDWQQLAGRRDVRTVNLPGADHTFSSRTALDAATRSCVEWLATLSESHVLRAPGEASAK